MFAFANNENARSLSFENHQITIIDLKKLKGHEEINSENLNILKNKIKSDGILKMPIVIDKKTYVVLDGHHRLEALKELGYKRIPVKLVDYNSPDIVVSAWRVGESVTKNAVINAGLSGRKMLPKTSRHMINLNGKLEHISVIENEVNMFLEKLK